MRVRVRIKRDNIIEETIALVNSGYEAIYGLPQSLVERRFSRRPENL